MNEPEAHREHVSYTLHCDEVSHNFRVRWFSGHEGLNRSFEFRVELRSDNLEDDLQDFLGHSVVVEACRARETPTAFPGIVDQVVVDDDHRIEQSGTIRVVPALALLEMRRNTRVFQQRSALEIAQEPLEPRLAEKNRRLDATALEPSAYLTRDYCVQYRETDLAFVHRLFEEEGIGYFFDRSEAVEVLVLFDDSRNLSRVTTELGRGLVPYLPQTESVEQSESVTWFSMRRRLTPRSVEVRDLDWTRLRGATLASSEGEEGPEVYLHGEGTGTTLHEEGAVLANLLQMAVQAMVPDGLAIGGNRIVRDLLGVTLGSFTANNLEHIARLRRELQVQEAGTSEGKSKVLGFTAGAVFELMNHPGLGADGPYLITRVFHNDPQDVPREGYIDNYENRFSCVAKDTRWRPVRRTPKPTVSGVQTAEVVGPVGTEVHTDAFGRIKVRFPWDRAEHDAMGDYTCWLRVSQVWAGPNYPGPSGPPSGAAAGRRRR